MKSIEQKVADRVLPAFNEVCGRGNCKHPKCVCGHCQRNYHIGKIGECTSMDILNCCPCKKFRLKVKK